MQLGARNYIIVSGDVYTILKSMMCTFVICSLDNSLCLLLLTILVVLTAVVSLHIFGGYKNICIEIIAQKIVIQTHFSNKDKLLLKCCVHFIILG